jgi:hypothetical protein
MARWRRQDEEPVIPDWIRHECDGGFVQADWAWPEDFGLDPMLAEHRARGRWVATRHRWLSEHPDVADILLEQLRERCREKRGERPLLLWVMPKWKCAGPGCGRPPYPGRPAGTEGRMDPAELAETQAAFERGYAADRERQAYYSARPGEGVPIGWDPPPDSTGLAPAGLGYSRPPRADAVFVADDPGPVPHVLDVPMPFDLAAPPSVTGSMHAWGQVPGPGAGNPGGGLVYLGLGEDQPRRSLLQKLLRRR